MNVESIDEVYCIGTRVLLKVKKVEQVSEGGIALPDVYIEKEQNRITEGKIIDYGKMAFQDICDPSEIPAPGEEVFFVKFAGKALQVKEDEYRVVNDEDIFLIKKKEKTDA
jgi:co-chaperonin GroES (HSP10)